MRSEGFILMSETAGSFIPSFAYVAATATKLLSANCNRRIAPILAPLSIVEMLEKPSAAAYGSNLERVVWMQTGC